MTIDVLELDANLSANAIMPIAMAMAMAVAGYKQKGEAPKEDETIVLFTDTKTIRAGKRGASYNNGKRDAVVKVVSSKELISFLLENAKVERAEKAVPSADDSFVSVLKRLAGDADVIQELGEIEDGEEKLHEVKLVLESNQDRVEICVHCLKKLLQNDKPVPASFKDDRMIKMMLGSLLANADMQ